MVDKVNNSIHLFLLIWKNTFCFRNSINRLSVKNVDNLLNIVMEGNGSLKKLNSHSICDEYNQRLIFSAGKYTQIVIFLITLFYLSFYIQIAFHFWSVYCVIKCFLMHTYICILNCSTDKYTIMMITTNHELVEF